MFVGKKRAGKDIATSFFRSHYGGYTDSFAAPIYEIMYSIQDKLGIARHKDRDILKFVGALGRAIDPNFWINKLKERVFESAHRNENVFISDGRFENELNEMRKMGFILVKIHCSDSIRKNRLLPEDVVNDADISENGYPADYPFDMVITNEGTLEEFHNALWELGNKVTKNEIKPRTVFDS
jgi:hypothetical protein